MIKGGAGGGNMEYRSRACWVREESRPSIQLLSLFSLFVRHESMLYMRRIILFFDTCN
jgi:hypothetical protein